MHRDSTGVVQRIEPGAVNWMSAGRGIVHSERTPKELVGQPHRSHGLQLWIALPEADEDSAPSFQHVAAPSVPRVRIDGATAHVVAGTAFGATLAGRDRVADARPGLRSRRRERRRDRAAGRRRERARALCPRSSDRGRRREVRRVHDGRARARGDADARRAARRARRARRRRAARPSLPVVEFRRQHARADPRRRGRLAGAALRAHARRDRVHPAARARRPPSRRRPERLPGCSISALPATASSGAGGGQRVGPKAFEGERDRRARAAASSRRPCRPGRGRRDPAASGSRRRSAPSRRTRGRRARSTSSAPSARRRCGRARARRSPRRRAP